jgi:hypothetical protein
MALGFRDIIFYPKEVHCNLPTCKHPHPDTRQRTHVVSVAESWLEQVRCCNTQPLLSSFTVHIQGVKFTSMLNDVHGTDFSTLLKHARHKTSGISTQETSFTNVMIQPVMHDIASAIGYINSRWFLFSLWILRHQAPLYAWRNQIV